MLILAFSFAGYHGGTKVSLNKKDAPDVPGVAVHGWALSLVRECVCLCVCVCVCAYVCVMKGEPFI